MKKCFLLFTILVAGSVTFAQNYETIKNQYILQQFQKAKDDLDKKMTDAKFTSKPEAYILKSTIYGNLSVSETKKNTEEGLQLADAGDEAFRKYREMDPAMALVSDAVYQNGPINLYTFYYTAGYNDYEAKKYESAFGKLKKAVGYSDLLIAKKILPVALDTNVLILAGITAENSGHKDEAVSYYSRLADNKVSGDGFESVYRFLTGHYFSKKDYANFEKYKALGGELYPQSEYFTYDRVDFAVGLEDNFDSKLKALDEFLVTDPANYKANQIMGELIYDTLNPKDETTPLPANAPELEKKMNVAFRNAATAKPGNEISWLFLGDHYINKAAKTGDDRDALAKELKAKTKPGQPNSKEDIARRDALEKKYGDALEQAREPYENAVKVFEKRTDLNVRDKQQYKKAVSYLVDIAAYKKVQAKPNSPEYVKYAAEEKKWNDLWDKLK
jgi:hypothetical protein